MSDVWVTIASVPLAGAFAWAGTMKVLEPERWRLDLVSYQVSRLFRVPAFLLLPWIELGISLALVAGAARSGAVLAIGLLGIFCVAIVRARLVLGSDKLGCGCFGGTRIRDYRLLLARNLALAALAGMIIVSSGRHPSIARGLDLGGPGALPLLLSILAVIAVAWIVWQMRQWMRRQAQAKSRPG